MQPNLGVRRTALSSTIIGGILACAAAWPVFAADVTQQRLESADSEPQNWILPFQNYQGYRFSRLTEINKTNVKSLHVAFTVPLNTAMVGGSGLNLENHAIVDDGFMYLDDGWGAIYKLDLHAGDGAKIVWKADGAVSKDESNRTRGVSVYGNNIYHELTDGRVIAVNRDTGEFVWDKQIARVDYQGQSEVNKEKENFTSATLPINGKIIVGQANGDALTRGWIEAVDAKTGSPVWRTYMVPGVGEPGHETWKDTNDVWKVGGAAVWTTGTYDPTLKLMFYGTGNAQPMYDVQYRPGDNLYAGSVVALSPDDGKIHWYFQYTPNEGWDYDETSVHQVIRTTVNGLPRTILYHWGRNGFAYRIDATNGYFVDSAQYIDGVNWTKGIDTKTGKPVEYDPALAVQIYIPETRPTRENGVVTACPNTHGGVRWQPPAYNPDTHTTYTVALTGCFTKQVIASVPIPNGNGLIDPKLGGGIRGAGPTVNVRSGGSLSAADVTTNKITATVNYPYENESGVLATATGLIVTGYLDGRFVIYDDKTLQELWHFNSGIALKAPFIAYSVNGKEYLAVIAGGATGASLASQHPALANQTTGAVLYVFSL